MVVQGSAGVQLPSPTHFVANRTLFEIASNTKVLTAIATQRLVAEGTLGLGSTLAELWGAAAVAGWNQSVGVANISVRELISHTSGLAKLPSNLHGTPANPFTGYTEQDLLV